MTNPYSTPDNETRLTPLLDHTLPEVNEYTAVFEPGMSRTEMLEEARRRARANGLVPEEGPMAIEQVVELGSASKSTWPKGIVLFTIPARELRVVERPRSEPEFNRIRLMKNRRFTGQSTKREVRQ